jgi:hypothetical protein
LSLFRATLLQFLHTQGRPPDSPYSSLTEFRWDRLAWPATRGGARGTDITSRSPRGPFWGLRLSGLFGKPKRLDMGSFRRLPGPFCWSNFTSARRPPAVPARLTATVLDLCVRVLHADRDAHCPATTAAGALVGDWPPMVDADASGRVGPLMRNAGRLYVHRQ